MSKIGLKLANGEFYPVLEEATAARKRLVVTTVQDGQRSVQIDIYRGAGSTVAGAEYVGSLVIDNIPFSPKGEPDIRLDLEVDAEGRLKAYAEELSSGEHQSIELSLEALNQEGSYGIPDFALGESTDSLPEDEDLLGPEPGAGPAYSGAEIAGSVAEDTLVEEKPGRRPLKIALFAILALVLALGAAWLVYHYAIAPRSAQVEVQPSPPPPPPPAPVVVEAPPPAPVVEEAPPPPPEPVKVVEAPKPKTKTPGVNYKLRWGDTLWDLSYTYYQNPWLFGKIARANKIKNPDYIIAGHTIWIPPR